MASLNFNVFFVIFHEEHFRGNLKTRCTFLVYCAFPYLVMWTNVKLDRMIKVIALATKSVQTTAIGWFSLLTDWRIYICVFFLDVVLFLFSPQHYCTKCLIERLTPVFCIGKLRWMYCRGEAFRKSRGHVFFLVSSQWDLRQDSVTFQCIICQKQCLNDCYFE